MTKEPGQPPKAVNIIRPNINYHNNTSTSTSGSSNTSSQQQIKRNGKPSSVLSSASNRKPRVNTVKVNEKPVLNLYHPPSRKPSYDRSNSSSSRPPIEIYKPIQQQQVQVQQRMTKSFTAPSLTVNEPTTVNTAITRSISPFHIRPSHRSVLGPINTPVAANQGNTTIVENIENEIPSLLDGISKLAQESDGDDMIDEEEEEVTEDEDNTEDEDEEEEEPVVNEARVNRKIADLELSINSLLSVNSMLEATVRKQALQLNQMKNKMLSGESVDTILDEVAMVDIDQDESGEEEEEIDWDKDVIFQRLRKITEYMIEQGQKSIDFEYKILGRVLSNYEHEDDEEDEDEDEEEDDEDTKEDEDTLQITTTLPEKSKSDSTPRSIPPSSSSIPLSNNHSRTTSKIAKRKFA